MNDSMCFLHSINCRIWFYLLLYI